MALGLTQLDNYFILDVGSRHDKYHQNRLFKVLLCCISGFDENLV